MDNLFSIIIGVIFVNNYVLAQFLGICPALGVSNKVETAQGMSMAVIFTLVLASVITYFIQHYVLDAFELQYLQTITFIIVIASLVQFIEMFLKKSIPRLYDSLGVFLPLITTNCVVLGVCIQNITAGFTLPQTIVYAAGAGIGFSLVLIALAAVRERLEFANVPEAFKGVPIALVSLGLMSIAFMGFAGLV